MGGHQISVATKTDFRSCVQRGWRDYPAHVRDSIFNRISFESALIRKHVTAGGVVADLGAGWGALCMALACQGHRPILIDDHSDGGYVDCDPRCDLIHELGIDVRRQCVTEVEFEPESLGGACCIAVLEHVHGSPREWLSGVVDALKPGGMLLLGGPNCCHILKRVRAVMGRTAWSDFDLWWDKLNFRGHVREPSAADYRRMITKLGLRPAGIYGRNFEGLMADSAGKRFACATFDGLLRMRPGLCSEIYVVGLKA
jgi:2-polyprenyl-3-methyl-5-hydroxy-6-metoxy-1,4-benzoquinol methylase